MLMTRPTAARRGYDARWQAAIAAYKDIHPWCIGCWVIGVRRETEVVDHVVPHRGDPALFWCEANWQPSCAWHHGAIKPVLERDWRSGKIPDAALRLDSASAQWLTRMKYRPAIGADGYPIEGT
jgi:5-methylcytosine-specific restriction protein A